MSATICSKRARVSLIAKCLGPLASAVKNGRLSLGLEQRRQLDLGLLGSFLQTLQRHLVFGNIDALIALEFLNQPVNDALVDVVAAQVRIAVSGLHFHHAVADFENRNVEGAAAEIVHRDGLVLLAVQPVSQRRRRRLVDDTHHFQPRDLAGVLGSLPLRVVEIGRNRDDSLGDLLAQISLGRFLQLAQDHRRNLRRRILLAADVHAGVVRIPGDHFVRNQLHLLAHFIEAPSHEALDRINRVLRIGDGLALRHLPHQPLAALGEADYRRSRPPTFLVRDDDRLPAFHNGDHGVGGAQIDANDFAHNVRFSLPLLCVRTLGPKLSLLPLCKFSVLLSSLVTPKSAP